MVSTACEMLSFFVRDSGVRTARQNVGSIFAQELVSTAGLSQKVIRSPFAVYNICPRCNETLDRIQVRDAIV
jgi:hypothetical protein